MARHRHQVSCCHGPAQAPGELLPFSSKQVRLSKGASLVAGGMHGDAAVPRGEDGPQRLHVQDGVRRQSKHLQSAGVWPGGCRTHARPARLHRTQHRRQQSRWMVAAQQAVIPSQAVRLCQDGAAAHLFKWRHALGSCLVSEVQRASDDADLCRRQVAPKVLVNAVHVDQGFQLSSPEEGLQQKWGALCPESSSDHGAICAQADTDPMLPHCSVRGVPALLGAEPKLLKVACCHRLNKPQGLRVANLGRPLQTGASLGCSAPRMLEVADCSRELLA